MKDEGRAALLFFHPSSLIPHPFSPRSRRAAAGVAPRGRRRGDSRRDAALGDAQRARDYMRTRLDAGAGGPAYRWRPLRIGGPRPLWSRRTRRSSFDHGGRMRRMLIATVAGKIRRNFIGI